MTERETLRQRFYNTCSRADSDWALARICPEPIGPMMNEVHVTAERFGRVPRTFIQTLQDKGVFIEQQRAMCAVTPCDVIEMDTDHSPFLCAPEAFAAHLNALTR